MSSNIVFSMDQMVIYPAHGVGQIVGIEDQTVGDVIFSVYVIYFAKEKMTIKVPTSRAEQCGLRSLTSSEDIKKVFNIIQSKPKSSRGMMWSRRHKEYDAKINSGNIFEIAEVIRDLIKNVEENPDCSYSERMVYENALNRLAGEVAAIKLISVQSAIEEIISIVKVDEQV